METIKKNSLLITGSKDLDGTKLNNDNNYKVIRISSLGDYFRCIFNIYKCKTVYFNSFFSFRNTIIFILFTKIFSKKIIIAPRGELFKDNLNLKKKIYIFFFKLIKKNIIFHCTSTLEKKSISSILEIDNDKLVNIRNLVGKEEKNKTLKIKDKKFLYFSRIDSKKNLLGLCKTLSQTDGFLFSKKIYLDIYGYIYDEKYFQKCKKYFYILKKKNIILKYCGHINPTNKKKVFSKYLVLIHPSKNENFGHVIIEALSFGLNVITSKNTFFSDLNKNNCGFNINFSDKNYLLKVLNYYLSFNKKEIIKNTYNSINYYKKFIKQEEKFSKKYINLLLS